MPRRRRTAHVRAEKSSGHLLGAWLALNSVLLLGSPCVAEDPFGFDPVRRLRQALSATSDSPDLAARRQALEQGTAALCSLPDLREALLLSGWRDEDVDEALAAVDRAVRSNLARRFEHALCDILKGGDAAGQMAAANMLSESGDRLQTLHLPGWEPRVFGGVLAELVRAGNSAVRAAAARALGQIHAEPSAVVAAFRSLCQDRDPALRRAGASGLITVVHGIAQAPPRPTEAPRDRRLAENLAVLRSIVPVASAGLADPDGEVRRLSMEALREAGQATAALVASPPALPAGSAAEPVACRPPVEVDGAELELLVRDLSEMVGRLTPFLGDRNPAGRLLAHQTVEALSTARRRLEERVAALHPADPDSPNSAVVAQVQARETQPTPRSASVVRVLAWGASDPDVQIRRTAVKTLELLGPEAKPAAHALVCALGDRDVFVRWTAARTLGRMGPVPHIAVVPGLIRLLADPDPDVQLAAAEALASIGPAAQGAVSALGRGVATGTPELRLACLRALESIGLASQAAIPAVTTALRAPNRHVRTAAARLLGRFGPAALAAKDALRAALQDPDADVRQTASDALLQILPPPERSAVTVETQAPSLGNSGQTPVVPASFTAPARRHTLFAEDR